VTAVRVKRKKNVIVPAAVKNKKNPWTLPGIFFI
jgi:hypothetical protein